MIQKKAQQLSISERITIIAISSHQHDYRLSWALNISLGMQLAKSDDFVVTLKQLTQSFSMFSYNNEQTGDTYQLIANKSESGYFLNEFKNIDFFLFIYGELPDNYVSETIRRIRSNDLIITAFLLSPDQIKSHRKLIFKN